MADILTKLEALGIPYRVVEHAPVFTVAESALHLPDTYPVKNLLLKEEKGSRFVFVIMKGDERLDTKLLATKIASKKLRFASADDLMEKLGVLPGSASLFSLMHEESAGIEVVFDRRLFDQQELGFHPSENTRTILIPSSSVKLFLGSIGFNYEVINLMGIDD